MSEAMWLHLYALAGVEQVQPYPGISASWRWSCWIQVVR